MEKELKISLREKAKLFLRAKAKLITLYGGALAAVLSVVIYWSQIDGPDMPWVDDVAAVEISLQEDIQKVENGIREEMVIGRRYAEDSRKMILNGDWLRINTQVKQKRAQLARNPADRELMRELSVLERTLLNIDRQIEELDKRG